MPDMTDEELKNAVRFEAEKFIPFDIKEYVLDFHIQGKDAGEKSNIDILLAAAKRDFVLQKIKIVEEAGFGVNIIDVDSFAATNAFLKNYTSIKPDKTVALLNMGAAHTNLIILKDGVISFVRDLAIGVGSFRISVSKKCGVDMDMPEWLKGVPAEKALEIRLCAKAALASLVDEIKLSFGYHENQSGRDINQIYISGGGAGFIGLEEALSEAFGSKPERWNPFQFLDINPSGINVDEIARINSSFAVAAGLALRGCP
jgi:type IV pilus assembly protein PilM